MTGEWHAGVAGFLTNPSSEGHFRPDPQEFWDILGGKCLQSSQSLLKLDLCRFESVSGMGRGLNGYRCGILALPPLPRRGESAIQGHYIPDGHATRRARRIDTHPPLGADATVMAEGASLQDQLVCLILNSTATTIRAFSENRIANYHENYST